METLNIYAKGVPAHVKYTDIKGVNAQVLPSNAWKKAGFEDDLLPSIIPIRGNFLRWAVNRT